MFSLSELVPQQQQQTRSSLLKPCWEVFMDHLVVLMLLTSVLTCTVQLSRDRVICLPSNPEPVGEDSANHSSSGGHVTPLPRRPTTSEVRGRQTHLVYQQYVYISQVCYHEALPLCSRFFPYLALLQSLVLLASGSFWLHFPHTSARIEHFLTILAKCCESPWTSQALTRAARQESIRGGLRPPPPRTALTPRPTPDSETDLLLKTVPPSPGPSSHSCDSVSSSPSPVFTRPRSKSSGTVDSPGRSTSLDRSDGEQARALFERVRKFRSHCESSAVIYKVYLAQTILKLLVVTLILSYSVPLSHSLSFHYTCRPGGPSVGGPSVGGPSVGGPSVGGPSVGGPSVGGPSVGGYTTFQCIHVLSSLLHKLLLTYVTLLGAYGLLNIYALSWILHRDVPDLRNDLAFLLHMLDQYSPLLSQRLSMFLCPLSEGRVLQERVERIWDQEKLEALIREDGEGTSRLHLLALPHLPPALFTLRRLHVLQLELIKHARFTPQVSSMTSLRELHLTHCTPALDPGALGVLQERLEIFHLTFSQPSEIPTWILSLRNLHELHLCGRLSSEGGVGRSWALQGSLRQLRHLRVLVLRGMLHRIPGELCEVSGSLVRLEIHNESTRLLVLTGLKRLVGLTELLLRDCQLERLPSALMALAELRTLDLQHNNLRTLEELLSLAQLQHLSGLRLAYNHVLALPASVGVLRGLELLDLSSNQIRSLPPALFTLRRLRRLLLGGNLLQDLPAQIKSLQLLTELDLSGNRLERLPSELFHCPQIRILNLAHNSLASLPEGVSALNHLSRLDLRTNSLERLPVDLGGCSQLHRGGLLVEDWLFLSLPRHIRDLLNRSSPAYDAPESDSFPFFSPTQWSFSSALESQI